MTKVAFDTSDTEHQYKVREVCYLIDENGYDINKAMITDIDGTKITVRMEEDTKEVYELEGTERLLVCNKVNNRIFREQEMKRAQNIRGSSDEEEAEEDFDEDEDSAGSFDSDDDEPKKGKKNRKMKSKKEIKIKPRPAGARSNPRRGQAE